MFKEERGRGLFGDLVVKTFSSIICNNNFLVTNGAGTTYLSGTHEFTLGF
jgi:hypothetical protein